MVLETDSLSSGQLGCEGIFSNNPLRRVFESTFVQAGMPIQTEQDLSHLFRISASSAGDIIYYYLSKPAPDFFSSGPFVVLFFFPTVGGPITALQHLRRRSFFFLSRGSSYRFPRWRMLWCAFLIFKYSSQHFRAIYKKQHKPKLLFKKIIIFFSFNLKI